MMRRRTTVSWRGFGTAFALALAGALLAGCGDVDPQSSGRAGAGGDAGAAPPLVEVTEEGPVKATVTLSPSEPRIGDTLVLLLEVEAEKDVGVEMPAFGDALGRFSIIDFAPRRETDPDGSIRLSQRYALQVSTSGRQRIPRLRLEYLDEREGPADVDAEPRELLTEELVFEVASVLPEGDVVEELRPPRAALPELHQPWWQRHWPWLVAGGLVLGSLVAAGVMAWRRRAEARARLTAIDRALARLERLERGGLPEGDAVDPWYVELSDIVRRYIEERFALRAPELTTEEFLVEAGSSVSLLDSHRELLSAFLERCDRVKFAQYHPGESESREVLELARRFLEESRFVAEEDENEDEDVAPDDDDDRGTPRLGTDVEERHAA